MGSAGAGARLSLSGRMKKMKARAGEGMVRPGPSRGAARAPRGRRWRTGVANPACATSH
jgi:hypothetical protein